MDRRGFLRNGLVGGGLLALSGAGLFAWPTRRDAAPRTKLAVFDEREFAILAQVAARVVRPPGAEPGAIAEQVDRDVSLLTPEVQGDIKKLLLLFDNALAGLVLDGNFGPFTRMSPERQDRVLEAWRDSSLTVRRAGYHSLRKLCLGAYYRDPKTWALSGYPGPPTVELPK